MLEEIVIRDAANSAWLRFSDPVDVLVAHRPSDVLCVLSETERRVNDENLIAAGFLSYEAAPGLDPAFVTRRDHRLPLVCFGLFPQARPADVQAGGDDGSQAPATWRMTGSREHYVSDLARIKRQIELGNTYQINYTVRQHADGIVDPWQLFLAVATDAPYSAYVATPDIAIVSASPELFFELNGQRLVSRPMKGTAQRGLWPDQDLELRGGLRESRKNRAENVMITDMVRNDIGRIAAPGSVSVPALFDIEKYPTVWQMTSTVTADTSASVCDILRALFPCASVTGAPKASSMGIIAALEDSPREVYTGAIGYIAPARKARFNVAIRTAWIDRNTHEGVYGVGGGIVWDSDPEEEYRECLAKSRVLASSPAHTEFELLETMLWSPESGYFLLDKHLDRLSASAAYFDFACDRATVEQSLQDLAARLPRLRHRIRLLLDRRGRVRMTQAPIPAASRPDPQRITLARKPVSSDDPFLYHKTSRRDVYERALRTAGGDDVLLWNEDGYITETTIANVIVRIGDELVTPPVECGLLAGTYRQMLLEEGQIAERPIHLKDIDGRSELILINSVRGRYAARLSTQPTGTLPAAGSTAAA